MGGRGGPRGEHPSRGEKNSAASQSPFAGVAQALENAENRLHLTPAQAPLWDRYACRVESLLDDQMRSPPVSASDANSALAAIARKLDVVRNRLAALEQIESAARALYLGLDPGQQKIADSLLPATLPALYSGLPISSGNDRGSGEHGDGRAPAPGRD